MPGTEVSGFCILLDIKKSLAFARDFCLEVTSTGLFSFLEITVFTRFPHGKIFAGVIIGVIY